MVGHFLAALIPLTFQHKIFHDLFIGKQFNISNITTSTGGREQGTHDKSQQKKRHQNTGSNITALDTPCHITYNRISDVFGGNDYLLALYLN
jgi:hypothetical protein